MNKLTDKVGLITGAARGIGLAIAQRLLACGASVALWDRDASALAAVETALAGSGRFVRSAQ
jgi:3-oxoacyl-[acyl-carrier protein] reductase